MKHSPTIFREKALKEYTQKREKDILPRFFCMRKFICMYVLLCLFLLIGLLALWRTLSLLAGT